ncbi:DUF2470 domain-containing protein [Mycoplasma sp. E35C]|uniref:DUF2470 domain-containing protein n=1 Tax=Mycoplasma sp. E35C TaxID=2801918 RepID=UPI001CA3F7F5|nr:DUF2470 domain-containing protein [Mycoplasma sp. E35C]QZX49212.1 DUF2470 domain-containing protein [Mycoplasma sp. E35C]
MDKKDIINHVNEDHLDAIVAIYRHYIKNEEVNSIKLIDLDLEKMIVEINNQNHSINYIRPVNDLKEVKYVIIEMYQNAQYLLNMEKVQVEYDQFMDQNHRSVYLSTQNKNNELLCSSTILLKKDKQHYVYISKVAQHYQNIKHNHKNLGVLFIENSDDNKTEFLRNAVQFVADFEEINNQELAYELLDILATNPIEAKIANMLKKFNDFVLFKINLKHGRAKFGFGKAYDVIDHKLVPIKMEEEHRMRD